MIATANNLPPSLRMRHRWPVADRIEYEQRHTPQTAVHIPKRPFNFYGQNLAFYNDTTSKFKLLAGPAETGKTISSLQYCHEMCIKYPGAVGAFVRQTYNSMPGTVLEIYQDKILPPNCGVRAYGNTRPFLYIYPNGSKIHVGGLDNPNKILSGERDFIYVNQIEEILETAVNKMLSRVTGRAGHVPFAQLIGDANPGPPNHWILQRAKQGKLSIYHSEHRDNPTLYDQETGELTPQGIITMSTLDLMTGTDHDRLKKGLWVLATGVILDKWSDGPTDGNVTTEAEYIQGGGAIYWSIDDGYAGKVDEATGLPKADAHPRVISLYQMRANGRLCKFEEIWQLGTQAKEHINDVLELGYPLPEFVTVDKAAAHLRGLLHDMGFYVKRGAASVDESLKELHAWIAPDPNGWRRLLVHPRCELMRVEAVSYAKNENGRIIKQFDHAIDETRYMVWSLRKH